MVSTYGVCSLLDFSFFFCFLQRYQAKLFCISQISYQCNLRHLLLWWAFLSIPNSHTSRIWFYIGSSIFCFSVGIYSIPYIVSYRPGTSSVITQVFESRSSLFNTCDWASGVMLYSIFRRWALSLDRFDLLIPRSAQVADRCLLYASSFYRFQDPPLP